MMVLLEWIIVKYGGNFCLEIVLLVLRLRGSVEHSIYHRYALEDGVLPFMSMCRILVGAVVWSV